jgi:hypothetical protein
MKKTRKWLSPIDGHQMFGFTKAFVHLLLMDQKWFGRYSSSRRRLFRSPFAFVNEWPINRQYEPNPEGMAQVITPVSKSCCQKAGLL